MTKILVTGGSGKIGKKLVERLVAEGNDVSVVDLKVGDVPGVKYIEQPVKKLTGLGDIEIVYHLAASIDYKASNEELRKRNVVPTEHLLQLSVNCKQFIFMSTTSVYNDSLGPITEYSKLEPYSNYGWSKLTCEELVKDSGIPYTILRSSQVYGPEFEEGYLTILKHLQKGDMKIVGKGDNFVPLVHFNDLIDALVLVKDNEKALNETFNVDGDYRKTQQEFMELAAKQLEVNPPTDHVKPGVAKFFGRFGGKSRFVLEYIDKLTKNRRISIDKIKLLGFEPKVDLEEGIREVIEDFREKELL